MVIIFLCCQYDIVIVSTLRLRKGLTFQFTGFVFCITRNFMLTFPKVFLRLRIFQKIKIFNWIAFVYFFIALSVVHIYVKLINNVTVAVSFPLFFGFEWCPHCRQLWHHLPHLQVSAVSHLPHPLLRSWMYFFSFSAFHLLLFSNAFFECGL